MAASVLQPDVDLVRQMLADACTYCASKLGCSHEEVPDRLRGGCSTSHGYFRYALAKQLAAYLGSVDDRITAGYLFGSSLEEHVEPSSDINIILRVSQNSPALSSLLKWFDVQFLQEYKRLVEPKAADTHSLFDIHVVTEAEVAQRAGYAALINSLHTPALLVWERAS